MAVLKRGQAYLVGGAVRDALLGRPVHDRDWVVVGAQPSDLLDAGFVAVGRDFPVFLHPLTHEEYALARTERKTAAGYRGFVVHAHPDVTLQDDLARRDLTINAMAVLPDAQAGPDDGDGLGDHNTLAQRIIDPWGGLADLRAGVLRHVTPAFTEDPVRILRVARFAARFGTFTVAPDTLDLMRVMVQAGEVDALVPERVWQEVSRGLMEAHPVRMFDVLRACGALQRLLPELNALWGVPQRADYHPEVDTGVHVMMVLDQAARCQAGLAVRWACLMHDLGKATTPPQVLPRHLGHEGRSVALAATVAARWRVPADCAELASLVAAEHGNVHRSDTLGAEAVLRLLERCDALRRPARFAQALLACECDARGRLGFEAAAYPQRTRLGGALAAVQAVDTAALAQAAAQAGLKGERIGRHIRAARLAALAA